MEPHHPSSGDGESFDLVVVGSGLVGCAVAAAYRRLRPLAKIAIVESGIAPPKAAHWGNAPVTRPGVSGAPRRHPRTALDRLTVGPPGAPFGLGATSVGGAGNIWSCVAPRMVGSEVSHLIAPGEWQDIYTQAEDLLGVTPRLFENSSRAESGLASLRREFPELLRADAPRHAPIACQRKGDALVWTGAERMLDPLLREGGTALLDGTTCVRLRRRPSGQIGLDVVRSRTGEGRTILGSSVVVAADALRTPRLLWVSGVRPRALGRYLSIHTAILGEVPAPPDLVGHGLDNVGGILLVPYSSHHPFHGQVMLFAGTAESGPTYGLGWMMPHAPTPASHIRFHSGRLDSLGLPAMSLQLDRGPDCTARMRRALRAQSRAGLALSGVSPTKRTITPTGWSIHYLGTTRMGLNERTSVCDTHGRVWTWPNLFVAGSGVIPTETATNPTLTSVALAVRTARAAALQ